MHLPNYWVHKYNRIWAVTSLFPHTTLQKKIFTDGKQVEKPLVWKHLLSRHGYCHINMATGNLDQVFLGTCVDQPLGVVNIMYNMQVF